MNAENKDTERMKKIIKLPFKQGNPYNCLKGLCVNSHIEKYKIIKQISHGTYGEVYKGMNKKSGNVVAIKKLKDESRHGSLTNGCLREICVLNQLKHDNLVRLIEVCKKASIKKGQYGALLYLIFEFCDYDLSAILYNKKIIFTKGEIKMIGKQILEGLYFMHKLEFMHRDLKPSNIFLTGNGILKIGDFGLARPFFNSKGTAAFTNYVVTLWYRPPELLLGETFYGPSIDIWSYGCIITELWTRKPLFMGNSEQNQLDLILRLCGGLNPRTWPGVEKYELFRNVNHVDYKRKLQQKLYPHVMDSCAVTLINSCLTLDPNQRCNVDDAINSEYFWSGDLPENLQSLIKRLPSNMPSHSKSKMEKNCHKPQKLKDNQLNQWEPRDAVQVNNMQERENDPKVEFFPDQPQHDKEVKQTQKAVHINNINNTLNLTNEEYFQKQPDDKHLNPMKPQDIVQKNESLSNSFSSIENDSHLQFRNQTSYSQDNPLIPNDLEGVVYENYMEETENQINNLLGCLEIQSVEEAAQLMKEKQDELEEGKNIHKIRSMSSENFSNSLSNIRWGRINGLTK